MSSQLNVDTIVDKAGSGGTNVKVGSTSTFIGGSATLNLVKGVAKVTANITVAGSLNAASSLNVSSVADGATGLNTITVSSPFSNVKSAVPHMTNHDSGYNRGGAVDDGATATFIVRLHQSSSGNLIDTDGDQAVTIHGDLA
mgnify:CR=1 FL=1